MLESAIMLPRAGRYTIPPALITFGESGSVDDQAVCRRCSESSNLRTYPHVVWIQWIAVSKSAQHVVRDNVGELDVVTARRVVKIWPLDNMRRSGRTLPGGSPHASR